MAKILEKIEEIVFDVQPGGELNFKEASTSHHEKGAQGVDPKQQKVKHLNQDKLTTAQKAWIKEREKQMGDFLKGKPS